MTVTEASAVALDVESIRKDFPILRDKVHGKQLVYLDNAATTQKPQAVIDRLVRYYSHENSNVHRGVHFLSETATAAYERSRETVRRFMNAPSAREIIFVRGATEGINLVARTHVLSRLRPGDEILISAIEHHSNIVPWQMLCQETGANLRVVPANDRGEVLLDEYEKLLSERTRFVSLIHVSNALGTINPVKQMTALAHRAGAQVLLDGAQAAPHLRVDVQDLDCDFYVFSGHKTYGPTGIGALYGKLPLLEAMPPWQGGGDMILSVTWEETKYNAVPFKFEAGTPNIAGAVGLAAALEYMESIGIEKIEAHERELLAYATEQLSEIPQLRIIGTAHEKAAVVSFVMEGIHPHDIGTIVDQEGIAIRTGHHCAQPLMLHFKVPATARASFAVYNTKAEIDSLVQALRKVVVIFG